MNAPLPPDRGHIATEQVNVASADFDALSTRAQVEVMIRDHEAVTRAMSAAAMSLGAFVDALVPRVRGGGRLFYCGAGTSGRLGVLDASECPPTFMSAAGQVVGLIAGGDSALRKSSERMEDDPNGIAAEFDAHGLNSNDVVLAIAAGGTTPYALGAICNAKARGALTGFLTCSPVSLPNGCDHLIVLETGPEIITGSTRLKAGSATKLALNAITTILFTQLGKVHGNLMVDLAATNDKLVDRALRTLQRFDSTLTRESASHLLSLAEGRVKIAIIMQAQRVDAAHARKMLADADGFLRRALEAKSNAAPR